jgi:hypothetical protein
MEHVIPDKIKTYFYDTLIKTEFERFLKFNNLETKSFSPIIINSQNSYLSQLYIDKLFSLLYPEDKNIKSNYEHKLNTKVNFNVKLSKNCIEINPSEYGINDRYIISEYINEVSSMNNIATGYKKNIIIWNIDKLGDIAFQALFHLIKVNEDSANFICISQNPNKIPKSFFNIIIPFHIQNPSKQFYIDFFNTFEEFHTNIDEIEKIKTGCFDYSFNSFLKNIAVFYNFSLSSLDSFENSFRKFIESLYLKIISKTRIGDAFLEEIRNALYDLYVYHFTYNEVINVFIDIITNDKNISEQKKERILDYACYFNRTSFCGNKEVIHLEAFVYNLIHIYHENTPKVPRKIKT